MLPRPGAILETVREQNRQRQVSEINRRHVVVEEQRAANPCPNQKIAEAAGYEERAGHIRPLDSLDTGDREGSKRAPPQNRIAAAPDRLHGARLREVLPVSD